MSLAISLFCYSFFTGIALSMAFPALRVYWTGILFAAILCAAIAGFAALPRRRRDAIVQLNTPVSASLFRIFLVFSGLLLGYARHAATFNESGNRVPIPSAQEATAAKPDKADSATQYSPLGYFALRHAGQDETVLRITGIQHLLKPVFDDQRTPRLDAQGRWRVRMTVSNATCTVTLPADAGETRIPEPFSIITAVEVVGKDGIPSDAPLPEGLELLRLPNRIESFASPRAASFRDAVIATVLGRIHDDPDVYNAMSDDGSVRPRTVLDIEPVLIQPSPRAPFFPVESGRIQVTVSGPAPDVVEDDYVKTFADVSRTDALGNDIYLQASLEIPRPALNPDGFDFRKYLLSHGIGAQMYLSDTQRAPVLRTVVPEGADAPRNGDPITMFSLHLRDRMLRVIKKTLPFPQSAYVGGIALGMRYGMQYAECVLSENAVNNVQSGSAFLRPVLGSCQDFIADEFKRAGVNHVLAVSGLHVTIITALLVGIFTLLRIDKKYFVPFVLLALVVFAVITGARPSTMRAVIMNSLFLILWAYLHESLKTTVLLSAAIAGFVIMLQNPRLLTDPSFTLSFGAILSLGLLTSPCARILRRFRGNDFLALGVSIVLFHVVLACGWFRVAAPRSAICLAVLVAVVFGIGRLLARFRIRPIRDYGFADLPTGLAGFLAAQGAIQIGMMIPLSAYYFTRWPIIGSIANLIAIPLIGVVLQLSILACLIGLIPFVGPLIALVLNAANWVFCVFFMLIAHFASAEFPYPFVEKPSGVAIAVYYMAVAIFILWPRIEQRLIPGRISRLRALNVGLCFAILLALAAAVFPRPPKADGVAHASVISVGYGSSILFRAPDGECVLFDAGYTQPDRSRACQAERAVLPRLYSQAIRSLDALVILSDHPERLDGAALVLEQCLVRRLVLPPALAACFDPETNELRPDALDAVLPPDSEDRTVQESRRAILGGASHSAVSPPLAAVLKARRPNWLNRSLGIAIRIESSDEADLPSARLLSDTPRTFAALLDGGDPQSRAPSLLLPGNSAPSRIAAWLEDNPSIQAAALSDWSAYDASTAPFRTLAERGGAAILEFGSTPASLKLTLPRAAANYRRALSDAEKAFPDPSRVRSTYRDGAVEIVLAPPTL